MRMSWPLWYCISQETRLALWVYQYEQYGMPLDVLAHPQASRYADIEPRQVIERLMKMPPTRSRGVY